MPWSVDNPPDCAKNWTSLEKRRCVAAANAALKDGKSEEDAIFACIHAAGKSKQKGASDDMSSLAATDAEKTAQDNRSNRYGITIRNDGNVTKPSEWSSVADSQWGDPVNYLYPVPDESHAKNAKSRFQQSKSKYDSKSRSVVAGRLNRLLRKYDIKPIGEKADPESKMGYMVGEIQLVDDDEDHQERHGWVRIPAVRSCTLEHPWYGTMYFDDDLFESFIDNWQTDVLGVELAIDRHHKPEEGALAWVKEMAVEDGSLVLYAEPTSLGANELGTVFRYASIEFSERYVDPETQINYGPTLFGCAATNRPFVARQNSISVLSTDGHTRIYGNCENQDETEEEEDTVELRERGDEMPEDTKETPEVIVVATPAPEPETVKLAADQFRALTNRIKQLELSVKGARVKEITSACLARGVSPIVVTTAERVLMACEPEADATIKLTDDGESVNLFGAVTALLESIPGRLGEQTHSEDKPTPPTVVEEMTAEKAEKLARQRRAELGIKSDAQEDIEI